MPQHYQSHGGAYVTDTGLVPTTTVVLQMTLWKIKNICCNGSSASERCTVVKSHCKHLA